MSALVQGSPILHAEHSEVTLVETDSSPGGSPNIIGTHTLTKKKTKKQRNRVIFVTDWWGPGTSKTGIFSPKRVGL